MFNVTSLKPRSFVEVDGLRGIAILMVLFFHSYGVVYRSFDDTGKSLLNVLCSIGDHGVHLFFCISGFVICASCIDRESKQVKQAFTPSVFLRKRLWRIYPPFLLAFFLSYIGAIIVHGEKIILLSQDFFLGTFLATGLILNKLNSVSCVIWSLEIELQFYILISFLFFLLQKLKYLPILTLLLWSISFAIWGCFSFAGDYEQFLYVNLWGYFGFFIAGIIVFYINSFKFLLINKNLNTIIMFVLCAMVYFIDYIPFSFEPILWGAIVFFSIQDSFFTKFLQSKILSLIGVMCFSIYLLHYPAIAMINKILSKVDGFRDIKVIFLVIIGLLISVPFYFLIERRFVLKSAKVI